MLAWSEGLMDSKYFMSGGVKHTLAIVILSNEEDI